jgi:HEAT repeat protein
MRRDDSFYHHLLYACQSANLQHRLEALEDLRRHKYLDLVEAQFLLDRLNATSNEQEQMAILQLMGQIKKPLPVDALMTILADWETSTVFLRMDVARLLVATRSVEAIDLLIRLVLDRKEHPWLREALTTYLADWEEEVSNELLLTLLADPEPAVQTAALEALRDWPAPTIPIEIVLPYLQRKEKYVREAAIKTLLATERRIPIDLILSALNDPEPEVRATASHGCISLAEWFGDTLPLEPLLRALHDEYAAVRENILDAFGYIPLRIPVEPAITALHDPVTYVRCAAVETLGKMRERVPSSVYPMLQEVAGSDDSPHVRQRAVRTLLLLHGLTPAPLTLPVVDFFEKLEE